MVLANELVSVKNCRGAGREWGLGTVVVVVVLAAYWCLHLESGLF